MLTCADELATTIKGIRLCLGMNMTEFAQTIGVKQGQVRRYEAGRAVPSKAPLAVLLRLAEGAEKNPLLRRLTDMLMLGPLTEAQALSAEAGLRKHFDAMLGKAIAFLENQPAAGSALPLWETIPGIAPNLAKLLELVSALYAGQREVDASLVRILQLWCHHRDSDPVVRQCFADTAQYLEFLLKTKVTQSEECWKPAVRKVEGERKKSA